MGPIRCPETSVKGYHSTLRYTAEERRCHQHRGGSLKSRIISVVCHLVICCIKNDDILSSSFQCCPIQTEHNVRRGFCRIGYSYDYDFAFCNAFNIFYVPYCCVCVRAFSHSCRYGVIILTTCLVEREVMKGTLLTGQICAHMG
jgi:hypothetical protein